MFTQSNGSPNDSLNITNHHINTFITTLFALIGILFIISWSKVAEMDVTERYELCLLFRLFIYLFCLVLLKLAAAATTLQNYSKCSTFTLKASCLCFLFSGYFFGFHYTS